MRRPILLGQAEVISLISDSVRSMLDTEGLYIGSDPADPSKGEAPLVSMGGKIFAMEVGKELDPESFIEGTQIDGPFRASEAAPEKCKHGQLPHECFACVYEDDDGQLVGGLRWHRLFEMTRCGVVVELMAAACDDGIGVIASWTKLESGEWQVRAMDTEGGGWEAITDFHEGESVPPEPPTRFDDLKP